MEETDAQLQLKKRARRRLVGATAFVALVAVVLPMVMDQEPRHQVQEVEIRIPGQDEKPFAPKFAAAGTEKPAAKAVDKPGEPKPDESPVDKAGGKPAVVPPAAKVVEPPVQPQEKPVKPAEKPVEKPAEKKAEKPADKPQDKPTAKPSDAEAKRAAAILGGQSAEPAKHAADKGGEFVILIGAFANEGNVKQLRSKLGEQGVKTYTEPLDSPQGPKTRVRAGPFPNREAADKALEKMKRVGVSGVVTAK